MWREKNVKEKNVLCFVFYYIIRACAFFSRALIFEFLKNGVDCSCNLFIYRWLLLAGAEFFGVADGSPKHFTLVFNAFVFCQVWRFFPRGRGGGRTNSLLALVQ